MEPRDEIPPGARWKTSSYSGSGAQCVEVAVGEVVDVRDSKSPETGHLVFQNQAWLSFTQGFKRPLWPSGA
ncbi:DUF397 domain-containing protein [Actinokineospora sp. 24-640]